MKKIIAIVVLLGTVLAVSAEPATVPKTFSAGTPAKSGEVNANFAALAGVIQGMRHMALYQNGNKIGSSLLANVIILNSGYVVTAIKEKGTGNIIVGGGKSSGFHYTTTNCTGTSYISTKAAPSIVLADEAGYIAAAGSTAYYLTTTATFVTTNFNSSLEGGVCVVYKTAAAWGFDFNSLNGNSGCGWIAPLTASTLITDPNTWMNTWPTYSPTGTSTACKAQSVLSGLPVQVNNPAVTGLNTTPCTYGPAATSGVCVSSGQLKWE